MIADAKTVAVICKISRKTGKPAGPVPMILIGKSIRTMLPLPAVVVKLGACMKTQFGTIRVGSVITRNDVIAVSVADRSSMPSFSRSVYGAGIRQPQVGQYLTTVLRLVSMIVVALIPCLRMLQTRFQAIHANAITLLNTSMSLM
jgi:hypothetical protein